MLGGGGSAASGGPQQSKKRMNFFRRQPPIRDVQRERREWVLDQQRWKHQRDVERGYRIKWGYVAIAYLVEFMVIGASLAGAWLFAGYYSDGDDRAFYFMLLAPLVYAAVEL